MSGKSMRGLTKDMGIERGNLKDWLNGKSTPQGDSLLKFIGALGLEIRIEPQPKAQRPLALNEELAALRLRLEALEAQVGQLPTAEDLQSGLESLRRSIARAIRGIGGDSSAGKAG